MHPANDAAAIAPTITDGFAMLVKRADDVEGCRAGSDEERELAPIERAIGVYEGGTLAHRQGEGRQGLSATKEADMTDSTDEPCGTANTMQRGSSRSISPRASRQTRNKTRRRY
jgi:hypothetical protein